VLNKQTCRCGPAGGLFSWSSALVGRRLVRGAALLVGRRRVVGVRRALICAADNAQQECDYCDDQQYVDDASGMVAEEADGPDDEQDHGDGVQ
jgi:hypothetical protein